MKYEMKAVLKGLDGADMRKPKVVQTPQGPMLVDGDELFTLRHACTEALMGTYKDELIDGQEKFKRFQLSLLINTQDEPELATEDVAKIKLLLGKAYPPLTVGRCYELLEKKPAAPAPLEVEVKP